MGHACDQIVPSLVNGHAHGILEPVVAAEDGQATLPGQEADLGLLVADAWCQWDSLDDVLGDVKMHEYELDLSSGGDDQPSVLLRKRRQESGCFKYTMRRISNQ